MIRPFVYYLHVRSNISSAGFGHRFVVVHDHSMALFYGTWEAILLASWLCGIGTALHSIKAVSLLQVRIASIQARINATWLYLIVRLTQRYGCNRMYSTQSDLPRP